MRIELIEIPDTAHTVVETPTGRIVDLCATRADAEATAAFLGALWGHGYHTRPTDRADLAELFDFRLVSR